MRNVDLAEHQNSCNEHWRKAVQAVGDPAQCQAVNGWISDIRHFAELVRDDCRTILDDGGRISTESNKDSDLSLQDVEDQFDKMMGFVLDLEEQNREVARKHGIPLA